MKTKYLLLLLCCYFISINGLLAQEPISPDNPLHRWIGEWTGFPVDKPDWEDEERFSTKQIRIKSELIEDHTGILQSTYFYLGGQYEFNVLPIFFVPQFNEGRAVNQRGALTTTYPEPDKEIASFEMYDSVYKSVTETTWHSPDSASAIYRLYEEGMLLTENKYLLKKRAKEEKIPLPKKREDIGQHLLKTLKKIPDGPFCFTDQFLPLEGFHAIGYVDTLPMAPSTSEALRKITELERLKIINFAGIKRMSVKRGSPMDWKSIKYLDHSTSYLVEAGTNGEEYGDDIPCWDVSLRFQYQDEDYSITAYYFELKGQYHLFYMEPNIYP